MIEHAIQVKRSRTLTLNCNSIKTRRRRLALGDFLDKLDPAIVLLQETRCLNFHPQISSLKAYYHTGATEGSVGTSVLVKEHIHAELLQLDIPNIECTVVQIDTNRGKIAVGSVYLRCELSAQQVRTAITSLLSALSSFGSFIIGGDFNADCRTTRRNAKAAALRDAVLLHSHVELIVPSTATHRSGSRLDVFLIGDRTNALGTASAVTHPGISDHAAVELCFSSKYNTFFKQFPSKTRINYSHIDWNRFNRFVENDLLSNSNPFPLDSTDRVDFEISKFTSAIDKAINLYLKVNCSTQSPSQGLPPTVKQLFKDRAVLIRAKFRQGGKVYPNRNVLAFLNEELSRVEGELDRELTRNASADLRAKLIHIRPGAKMFSLINRVVRWKTGFRTISAIKNPNGEKMTGSTEIGNVFRDFYQGLYKAAVPPHDLPTQQPNRSAAFEVTLSAVEGAVKKLKNKKSAGPDGISNFIIRKLSASIVGHLAFIIRSALALNYFPRSWKIARIIVLPKVKGSLDVGNYRPISMVSCLGKVMERVLQERLDLEVDTLKIIPPYQTGFRKKHSTLDAAAILRDTAVRAFAEKKKVAVCFLDIRKAFDSVWKDGLVWKLRNFGITENLVMTIDSFLSNRSARVAIGGEESDEFAIERGVPQGTVLGPILYNIFLADQPSPRLNNEKLQYADDTACIAVSTRTTKAVEYLQRSLSDMEDYYDKWGLQLNGKKSELLVFERGRIHPYSIRVGGETVNSQTTAKYLGITFQRSLSASLAATRRKQMAAVALGKVSALLRSEFLDRKVKIILYKALIRPILTYGSPVWNDCSRLVKNSLCTIETRALRLILNRHYDRTTQRMPSNESLYRESNLEPLLNFIHRLNTRFKDRFVNHPNRWIRHLARLKKKVPFGRRRHTVRTTTRFSAIKR